MEKVLEPISIVEITIFVEILALAMHIPVIKRTNIAIAFLSDESSVSLKLAKEELAFSDLVFKLVMISFYVKYFSTVPVCLGDKVFFLLRLVKQKLTLVDAKGNFNLSE